MARLTLIAGFVAAGVALASPAWAGGNPLLGSWKAEPNGYADRDGFQVCKVVPKMVFTAKAQTMFTETTQGTTAVIYLVHGKTVWVSSTHGFFNAPSYTILGPNEIQSNAMGNCKYTRQ